MFEKDEEMLKYGFTAVENAFLMDYLPAAKGDYVKVYLWGLFACESKKADYTLEEMAQENPVGRNGTPKDVAEAIVYLTDADFITGQVLPVNGGYII